MNFLQPWVLAGLPLAALPIIIHLINQRRYRTTRWGAMMFLLAANRMSRGYARLRQWLILAARVAACLALILVVARPLTGGWLARAAGGKPDVTLLLIDRSPSMMQRGPGGTEGSKLDTGRRRLARTLKTVGSNHWVVFDPSLGNKPVELAAIDDLITAPAADPTSAPADIPALLAAALDYLKANKPGRAEVWICSDVRDDDWDADGGRWRALRDGFLESGQPVRFHLLAYAEPAPENLAVRVLEARYREAAEGPELLVTARVSREGGAAPGLAPRWVPIRFYIVGLRSVANVELAGASAEIRGHRIGLARGKEKGFGRVAIPADANPADDAFWFSFDKPDARRTVIVADDPDVARLLQVAASIAPDPSARCSAEVVAADNLGAVDWAGLALLLWQAPLPEGDAAAQIRAFVERGGRAIFWPPRGPSESSFLGVKWASWLDGPGENAASNWRGDQDLLAATQSGSALPVGALRVARLCGLAGDATQLATLKGGAPLLARVATDAGGAYFCATTPSPTDSSLASGGVVLYVLVQRALAAGAAVLGDARQLDAGARPPDDPTKWRRLDGGDEPTSADYPSHRGVYRSGERLLAVNRPSGEDLAPILPDDRVAGLFRGLDFSRVDDRVGSEGSLIQEIWRVFLTTVIAALVVEAALCLPNRRKVAVDDGRGAMARPRSGVATSAAMPVGGAA